MNKQYLSSNTEKKKKEKEKKKEEEVEEIIKSCLASLMDIMTLKENERLV